MQLTCTYIAETFHYLDKIINNQPLYYSQTIGILPFKLKRQVNVTNTVYIDYALTLFEDTSNLWNSFSVSMFEVEGSWVVPVVVMAIMLV